MRVKGFIFATRQFIACLMLFMASFLSARAYTKVLPINAINYISYFSKADFDELYPGKVLDEKNTLDEYSYYVVYQHEKLTYYFGPEIDHQAAQMYKRELDKTVTVVKDKREILVTAKTWIHKPSNAKTSAQASTSSNGQITIPNEKKPKPAKTPAYSVPIEPWWRTLFRVFGF